MGVLYSPQHPSGTTESISYTCSLVGHTFVSFHFWVISYPVDHAVIKVNIFRYEYVVEKNLYSVSLIRSEINRGSVSKVICV